MAYEILMPKLGLTMTEGTVEEWKFREGDYVKKGDALFSVSTDKLTNDVESEAEGVLLKILLPAGETAPGKQFVGYLGQKAKVSPAVRSRTKERQHRRRRPRLPRSRRMNAGAESRSSPLRRRKSWQGKNVSS